MGWTSTNYPKGMPIAKFFYGPNVVKTPEGYDEHSGSHFGETFQVAASGLVNRTEFYSVIRFKNERRPEFGPWFLAVYMVKWHRPDDWGHNFSYKDMEESMGPTITNCPLKVLKAAEKLCPIPEVLEDVRERYYQLANLEFLAKQGGLHQEAWEYSKQASALDSNHYRRQWRALCYENVRLRSTVTKVKAGDVIQFRTPIKFTDGTELDTFQVDYKSVKGSALIFKALGQGYKYYTIPRWKERPFEVIGHEETPTMRHRQEFQAKLREQLAQYRAQGYSQASIKNGRIWLSS